MEGNRKSPQYTYKKSFRNDFHKRRTQNKHLHKQTFTGFFHTHYLPYYYTYLMHFHTWSWMGEEAKNVTQIKI